MPGRSGSHSEEELKSELGPTEREEPSSDGAAVSDVGHAQKPGGISGAGWRQVANRVVGEVKNDRLPVVAAGLAFYAMLSVFPALIAAVSIYGLFADPSAVQRQLETIASALPQSAAQLIGTQLEGIVQTSRSALSWTAAIAVVGALWTASSGAQQLITAVNDAYDETDDRGFLALRGRALTFTLGFIVIGLVSLGMIVVIPPLLEDLGLTGGWNWVISIGRFVLLAGMVGLGLAVVYRYAPNRDDAEWEWVSWGALLATIIWIGASILFTLYVSNFGNFNETYGSLAGVIILLLWFFISGFVILLGAEINAEMEHQTTSDTTTGPERPMGKRGATKADTTPSTSQ